MENGFYFAVAFALMNWQPGTFHQMLGYFHKTEQTSQNNVHFWFIHRDVHSGRRDTATNTNIGKEKKKKRKTISLW